MSVKPGEHPWRGHRVKPEHDEREHVHQHQRIAQRPVQIRAPPPQVAQQAERDDEVGVVVVVGQDQPERVVPREPAVERQLGIDVQRPLQMQHAESVAEGDVQAQRREVRDRVIHPAQPHDHPHLDPPARAFWARLDERHGAGRSRSQPRRSVDRNRRGQAARCYPARRPGGGFLKTAWETLYFLECV